MESGYDKVNMASLLNLQEMNIIRVWYMDMRYAVHQQMYCVGIILRSAQFSCWDGTALGDKAGHLDAKKGETLKEKTL